MFVHFGLLEAAQSLAGAGDPTRRAQLSWAELEVPSLPYPPFLTSPFRRADMRVYTISRVARRR